MSLCRSASVVNLDGDVRRVVALETSPAWSRLVMDLASCGSVVVRLAGLGEVSAGLCSW